MTKKEIEEYHSCCFYCDSRAIIVRKVKMEKYRQTHGRSIGIKSGFSWLFKLYGNMKNTISEETEREKSYLTPIEYSCENCGRHYIVAFQKEDKSVLGEILLQVKNFFECKNLDGSLESRKENIKIEMIKNRITLKKIYENFICGVMVTGDKNPKVSDQIKQLVKDGENVLDIIFFLKEISQNPISKKKGKKKYVLRLIGKRSETGTLIYMPIHIFPIY